MPVRRLTKKVLPLPLSGRFVQIIRTEVAAGVSVRSLNVCAAAVFTPPPREYRGQGGGDNAAR